VRCQLVVIRRGVNIIAVRSTVERGKLRLDRGERVEEFVDEICVGRVGGVRHGRLKLVK
jgi:hypothetical protein